MEQEKPEDIVCDLNGQIYDLVGDKSVLTERGFSVVSTGYCSAILFGDFCLWNSDDGISYNDDEEESERTIRKVVMDAFENLQSEIAKLKFYPKSKDYSKSDDYC